LLKRALAAALLPALLVPALARAQDPLAGRLDAALAVRALRGARVGALVVDAPSGAVRFAHNADEPMVPASNQKILTALAALATFGPAHQFTTHVFADRPVDAGGAVGMLYVRGGGDPALTSEQVWSLVSELRRLGLSRVDGDLVLDDSTFDRERWHPSWGPVSARAYHAPVSGLSVNFGSFATTVTAGARPGDPVRVTIDPPVPTLRLVSRARTGGAGTRSTLAVGRMSAGDVEEVRVTGSVPAGAPPEVVYRSVEDPTRYAGGVIRMQLDANGIRVGGGMRSGVVPAGATELLAFKGRPLAEIVRLFVKYSNNVIAESLVKDLALAGGAAAGSWDAGVPVLRDRLMGLGLPAGGLEIVDGSGLSHTNRVTPRRLVDALRLASESFSLGPEFMASLPISATDGTLRRRGQDSAARVRAKTGLLDRVTGLSGFAETHAGETLVFSILVNGYRGSDGAAMQAVDGFVAALVNDGGR
jgi:D-alanyl-D-alanine carboxypeptidase/D-alanyl-D-alanine-endopeptidase (penicillin-binding protein 4)